MDGPALDRLETMAEVRWLELPGGERAPGPPPEEPGPVEELACFVRDLDVLVVSYGCPRVSAAMMDGAPRLKMIGDTHGDRFARRVDYQAAAERGVRLVDTTNASSPPVAEWALALILIGLRNAGSLFRRLVAGEVLWPDREMFRHDPGYVHGELTGKRVGLIALGNVGRRLVQILQPFSVSVVAHDPAATAALAGALALELAPLETVMAASDVVVCTAPLTEATRGLVGRRELDLLRPGTVLVNVSRGAVFDREALVARLERGDVIACLDVTDPEPLPAGSPLRTLGNVFLSPHIAGVTLAAEPRFFELMVEEIERFRHGYLSRYPLLPRT
jgi:phosphoglycerate dehydrogenase-like enzyme